MAAQSLELTVGASPQVRYQAAQGAMTLNGLRDLPARRLVPTPLDSVAVPQFRKVRNAGRERTRTMRPLEKLTDEELHRRHVAAVACSLDGRNRVRALETPVFGGDRTGNRDADRRRALEAEIFADAESDAVVRELVIRKDLAQLGAGTLALTGPRFTAVWDDRSPLAGSHGQVLFAVRATQELGSAYVDLRRNAGRTNVSRAVRAPGEWLGSTCGWSHTNLGRVQIERELRRNDLRNTRRFQVRLLAESGDAFLEAAAARPAA